MCICVRCLPRQRERERESVRERGGGSISDGLSAAESREREGEIICSGITSKTISVTSRRKRRK